MILEYLGLCPGRNSLFGLILVFGHGGGAQSWPQMGPKIYIFQIWLCYISLEAYFDADFRF